MIELIDVCLQRGDFHLPKTSLTIPTGSCGMVTGAAGAGKTSLVEAICGLQPISHGTLKLRGQDVSQVAASDRVVGYLPQDVVLFPSMTVAENIGFSLKMRRWAKTKIRRRTEQLAQQLELSDLLMRKPHQLSGGQQKRVAMARAVAAHPDIICLDEPFVSLDDHSRALIENLLTGVLSGQSQQSEQSATVLVVTHQPQWVRKISELEFRIQ